jgi:hypothetical protein
VEISARVRDIRWGIGVRQLLILYNNGEMHILQKISWDDAKVFIPFLVIFTLSISYLIRHLKARLKSFPFLLKKR